MKPIYCLCVCVVFLGVVVYLCLRMFCVSLCVCVGGGLCFVWLRTCLRMCVFYSSKCVCVCVIISPPKGPSQR